MKRYITIETQESVLNAEKREMVLLRGKPRSHREHCKFCDYYKDNLILKGDEIVLFNREVLSHVSGKFGVLEVINSGSVFELPQETIEEIRQLAIRKKITVLYFESFTSYIKMIPLLRYSFQKNGITLRFRAGLETFNEEFRINVLGKKIYNSSLPSIKKEYYSTCLLVGIKGQTQDSVISDIEEGLSNFEKITVNVFCKNTKEIAIDSSLVNWFKKHAQEKLKGNPRIEIFLDTNIL